MKFAVLLVAAPALLSAAALRPYDTVIPFAFEENRGQSPSAYRYIVSHANIGLACDAMYWVRDSLWEGIPAPVRIVGATRECESRLEQPDGSTASYYRGGEQPLAIEGNPRYGRARFILPTVVVEYRAVPEGIAVSFTFSSLSALRAFRLRWDEAVSITIPDRIYSNAGFWTVRALSGTVFVSKAGNETASFDVFAVAPGAPIGFEFTVPRRSITENRGYADRLDTAGSLYVSGTIYHYAQVDPTAATCDYGGAVFRCADVFLAKFDSEAKLKRLVYLMGRSKETVLPPALDGQDSVYLAGGTYSDDFPTSSGVLQERYAGPQAGPRLGRRTAPGGAPGGDAFVAKIDGATGKLIYSTYIGLTGHEYVNSMDADSQGRTYLRLSSTSLDFPRWGEPITGGTFCSSGFPYFAAGTDICTYLISLDEAGASIRYSKPSPDLLKVSSDGLAYLSGSDRSSLIDVDANGETRRTIRTPASSWIASVLTPGDGNVWANAYAPRPFPGRLLRAAPEDGEFRVVGEHFLLGFDDGGNMWFTPGDSAPFVTSPARPSAPRVTDAVDW